MTLTPRVLAAMAIGGVACHHGPSVLGRWPF